jgi:hypothetical protein
MRSGLRLGLLATVPPALALAAVGLLGGELRPPTPAANLLPPPVPAFYIPGAHGLPRLRDASAVAPIRTVATARVAPAWDAAPVAQISTRTPEGTTNIVQLLGTARHLSSGLWQRVRLAVLPNGTTGWVPRSALGGPMLLDTRLVISRRQFRATLFRDGRAVFSAPVGVGQTQSATPAGDFYIRDVLTRYRSPTYGPIAFGTSARSATLTGWPAGGYIGIHGTDQPGLIPGTVSHGCIRMRNSAILRLARLMPVGTAVVIR